MLIFVIPLKSKKVAKSWENTCQLLERCLRSICNQTDPNFKAIVVCHETPSLEFNHPNIHFLEVNFETPDPTSEDLLEAGRRDKSKKIIAGLLYAQQFSPTHIMTADADDCVNCHLAEYTNQHSQANGWVISKGYVYQENSPFIYYRKSHFYRWCGTCNIVRFDLCPLPSEAETYPEELIQYYSGHNHGNIKTLLEEKGFPLDELPFVGGVYIIGTGENIYQKGFSTIHNANRGKTVFLMKELLKFRLLTPSLREEFGLYDMATILKTMLESAST